MAALDESIRLTVNTLKSTGLWNNTFFVVTTDNGAMVSVSCFFIPACVTKIPSFYISEGERSRRFSRQSRKQLSAQSGKRSYQMAFYPLLLTFSKA